MSSFDNPNFVDDRYQTPLPIGKATTQLSDNYQCNIEVKASEPDRDKWGKDIEFLLSCIALSGNY
jgi:hypothetical protein